MNKLTPIYGAIIGDVIGSKYEHKFPIPSSTEVWDTYFEIESGCFTDDTVLTIAVLDHISSSNSNIKEKFLEWGWKYPRCGFSSNFKDNFLYNKGGIEHKATNGALMMLSPYITFLDNDPNDAINVTHNCDLARRCALDLIKFCRTGVSDLEALVPDYETLLNERKFDMSAIGTLLEAYSIYRESSSFEDLMRRNCMYGGDTDTRGAILGMIWGSFNDIDQMYIDTVRDKLTGEMLNVIDSFTN